MIGSERRDRWRARAGRGANIDGSRPAPPRQPILEAGHVRCPAAESDPDLDRLSLDPGPQAGPGRAGLRPGHADEAQEARGLHVGAEEELGDPVGAALPDDLDAGVDRSAEPAGPDGAGARGVDRAPGDEGHGRCRDPGVLIEGQRGPLGAEPLRVHDEEPGGRPVPGRSDLDGGLDAAVAEEKVIDVPKGRLAVGRAAGRIVRVEVFLDFHRDDYRELAGRKANGRERRRVRCGTARGEAGPAGRSRP